MGLLSTPALDARLVVGAYISHGVALYRVTSSGPNQVVLEDAFLSNAGSSHTQVVEVKAVLKDFKFERAPASATRR